MATPDEPGSPPSRRLGLARARHGVRGWLREVRPRRRHLRADLAAGLPGAVSSVPDGMAAALLAGVNPAHGLYASIAGPVAGGLTSSTRLMVVTTTSAAALAAGDAVSALPESRRSDALLWLTLVAGAVMLVAAASGLARFLRFVSYSVMLGFLSGVAVNMVLGQLPDLLGADAAGSFALSRAWDVLTHLGAADPATAACGLGALVLMVALARTRWAAAASLVALAVPTSLVLLLGADAVPLVEEAGAIPAGLPAPRLPDPGAFDLSLVVGACSVAALILVQGAGVAEAAPNTDGRGSPARDFSAQGAANLASGMFGGMPVGGSVGQTALNVAAGARSRWAAIWSGLWLAVILLVLSGVVGKVALPTLAAVLVFAGLGSLRPREVLGAARTGTIPAVAMAATFGAVLLLPIPIAVGTGVLASLLLQLNQEALDLRVTRLVRSPGGQVREEQVPDRLGSEVVVLNVYGSLFYAGARGLAGLLPRPDRHARDPVVVLRLRGRTTLGVTFLRTIGAYAAELDRVGGRLLLTGLDPALADRWERAGASAQLAGVRLFRATPVIGESTDAALDEATRDRSHHHVVVQRRPPAG